MTATHGTKSSYNAGCRCDDCRIANRASIVAWQQAIRAKPVPGHVHGSLNGYTNYGCRCEPCADAVREYHAAYRAR